MSEERIKGLDGLRAIAVLLVFATHKTATGNRLGLGGFGVHMFFVLSGFLIIGILHGQRQKIEQGQSTIGREWSGFTLRRTFRIFPVYYAVVAYMAMVGMIGPTFIAQAVTYTTNLNIAYRTLVYPPAGGHLWSLAVEEQFYLLAAPLILFMPSRHTRKICLGVIAVALASSVALLAAHMSGRSLYAGSFSNFGLMALGGIVALTPTMRRVPMWIGPVALAAYLGSVLVHGAPKQVVFWFSPALIALVIGALVSVPAGGFAAALDIAPLRRFGRISYGFYLLHPLVSFEAWLPNLPKLATVALDFIGVTAIAAGSWMLLERPALEYGHRFLKRRSDLFSSRGVVTLNSSSR